MSIRTLLAILLLAIAPSTMHWQTAWAGPSMSADRLALIDGAVAEAIAQRKIPGAVVIVGQGDRIMLRKAYGHRALLPAPEAMTPDTVFDLASLTKVVATTTAVMALLEDGRIRLNDPVSLYVPGFEKHGKAGVTLRHLLNHTSGLRPDVDLADPWKGSDTAIALAVDEVLTQPPGARVVYSDINFFLLGEIVQRASGRPFADFVQARLLGPAGMKDTQFRPPAALRPRIAPTEPCSAALGACTRDDEAMLRGVVHDPTARRMGGIAGHSGLFGTADDLARFCRMLLAGGALPGGARVLSPLSVARMTAPSTPLGETQVRGLGWDLDSSFSANRGELLPLGSFGHTGFTGTSLWLDPATQTFVVFLSSRLHPEGRGDATPVRARVATIAASALQRLPGPVLQGLQWSRRPVDTPAAAAPALAQVLNGIDVLAASGFAALKGLRIGLVTNHTGRTRDGQTTIDLLAKAPDVKLQALFSPEHGIRGVLDDQVPSSRDEATGLPIHSLYDTTRRPTPAMLAGLDALVVDLQDIGARFYTYPTTLAYVLQASAEARIKVFVLDRPNPIGGVAIEGPALDAAATSFVGHFPGMPVRHGMTLGELARLFNAEQKIAADLTVVAMRNWRRDLWFDETGLPWINPSPNMRNMHQATLYPGVGAIEYAEVSVGRGTDTPFEQIGAPWIRGSALAEALNQRRLPGLRFYPVAFTPTASKFRNQACEGVFIVVTDRQAVRPVRLGAELAAALFRMAPERFLPEANIKLLGSVAEAARLKSEDPAAIAASWAAAEARWRRLRAGYLLY